MRLSQFAVHRPIFAVMVTLIVVILGGVSLLRLPIDLMPDITYPTLSITTAYENASPEEIEELVTRPIEEGMSAVPGAEEVSSISAEGLGSVRVTFAWGTDLDAAANDIRDRLDRVIPLLPEDAERPRLRKFDLASFPILILGAASNLDPIQMRRIIDDQVQYRLERIPGVAAVDVRGGLDREIHVNLYPDKINALGLPLDQILNRIREENVNVPAGTIDRGNFEVMIRTPGAYTSLDEIENTVAAIREGVPIRIRDIASVEDSWQKVIRIVRINGKPGIRLSVNKQSGTNTVEVAKRVLQEVERINQDIPQVNLTPIIDTSDYIQRSISNLGYSAFYGGFLAVLVLLLFLRNIHSTAIIATAIPISVIATFALVYFGGFTLNIMTIGGLALGIGMLVDNAIVVLENIFRLRETGTEPDHAAVRGSEEVIPAIIASTLTTLAVFLPLVFVRGMSGVMFKQLSFVVGFSLLCSLGVAMTMVPMLAARVRHPEVLGVGAGSTWDRKISTYSGRLFTKFEDGYKHMLHVALDHRSFVIFAAVLIMIGSLALIPLVGVEFLPNTDEGEVRVNAEMQVGTRLEMMDESFQRIESIVMNAVPEMKNMVTYVGGPSWRVTGSHTGEMRVALKPQAERTRSSEEIAAVLRKKLSKMPGVSIRTRAGQGLFLLRLGTSGLDKVQVEIRGYDLDIANVLAEKVKRVIEDVDGVTDARVSRESGSPEELIIVDRQRAADMKLTVSQIADMLQTVLSGTHVSDYREAGEEYGILVKLKDPERLKLREILDLTLTNVNGQPVVLRNVVDVRPRRGPVLIERKDQERIVTVSANISGRDMGSILADIRRGLRAIPVPGDLSIVFGGDYEEQQKAFRELMLSLVLALVLVYMVMACLYESLRDPFVVMFSVPLAAIGVVVMLFLTKTTFNVQSFIGSIMLGGIVVNNAILLVDHTNLLRRRDGMPLREAIEEAGRRRLRPILMTAMTTIFGLIPLAIGLGEGSEAQAPMARAVIGGLLSSTLITLVFVPTVYSIFEREAARDTQRAKAINSGSFTNGQDDPRSPSLG
ncbi:MAG: MMPL family transporter [Proteobacteria bacterium]|nr:MMPL family transporter [Pseudomonadota bacterium]NIS68085.1 MMPL family transporter [Pseudomonadota bacterium]